MHPVLVSFGLLTSMNGQGWCNHGVIEHLQSVQPWNAAICMGWQLDTAGASGIYCLFRWPQDTAFMCLVCWKPGLGKWTLIKAPQTERDYICLHQIALLLTDVLGVLGCIVHYSQVDNCILSLLTCPRGLETKAPGYKFLWVNGNFQSWRVSC